MKRKSKLKEVEATPITEHDIAKGKVIARQPARSGALAPVAKSRTPEER